MNDRPRAVHDADAPAYAADAPLAAVWEHFADRECRGYSPLYERICRSVATDHDLLDLIGRGPSSARQPNLLLAAVHDLLLRGIEHPLAEVYAGTSDADPAPLFRELCLAHEQDLLATLSSRHTQTNEVGRCAAIVPALRWVADQLGEPLALVDVGASAGLNLLCDQVRIDYRELGSTGPSDSPVTVDCRSLGGQPPIRPTPSIVARAGLDREPVDLDDADAARWLLACVWPDTGRLERTAAAHELARRVRPVVHHGDAATDLAALLDDLPDDAVPCVTTTWVVAYLGPSQRAALVAQLAVAGRSRPLAWISAEGPGAVDLFAPGPPPEHDAITPSVLGAVVFDGDGVHPTHLGWVHPHGAWIDWRA